MTGHCEFGDPPHDDAVFCANCEQPVCGYHADRSAEDDELLCPPCAEAEAKRLAHPLQEAIAKALLAQINSGVGMQKAEVVADTLAEAVLGVLRADDDTRYVAITKQQRNALGSVCSARGNPSHAMRDAAWSIASAYDAVAPNAKEDA